MLQRQNIYKMLMLAFVALVNVSLLNAQTADLTSLNGSVTNLPVGTSISWHTATPATSANEITAGNALTDATAVPPGATYYMAFKDTSANCYSPTYPVPVLTNSCPTTTVDLTTLDTTETNNPGNGVTVSFHTGPTASTANLVGTATAVTSGTYYAAFYDSANNCYSDNTSPILVVMNSCIPLAPMRHGKHFQNGEQQHMYFGGKRNNN